MTLNLDLIQQASAYLKGKIVETSLEYSPALSHVLHAPTYLKLECQQLTGSFKVRGAFFRLSQLNVEERQKGIISCSAGNHGKALAYVGRELGVKIKIFVPKNVDAAKFHGMVEMGAEVIRSEEIGYDETEKLARADAKKERLPFISAFEDPYIMAGNGGTLAKEIFHQLPGAQTCIFPVGGGGLAAGFSFFAKEKSHEISLVGCQHKDSAALALSLQRGKAVTSLPGIDTVAGGIEGGIGEQCFEVIKSRIDHVALVSEEEIYKGFQWCLKHHQYLIEPSSAVVIAACLFHHVKHIKGPVVVILTGRNVGYSTIEKLICSN